MVTDVSVVRPCMRQLNSDQSSIKKLEKSVASVAVGCKASGSPEEEPKKHRIGYKIGCTGDWFMMKISATTSMQLIPTHKHIKVPVFAVLIVPCM